MGYLDHALVLSDITPLLKMIRMLIRLIAGMSSADSTRSPRQGPAT
jgi:hypothetical protein